MDTKVEAISVLQASAMSDDFIENQYVNVYLKQGASSHTGLVLCVFAMYAILL
jgi:hypothetical protein